jgi:DNA polymerase III epsilon subunit-like protein
MLSLFKNRSQKSGLPYRVQTWLDCVHPLPETPVEDIVWLAFDMEANSPDYRKAVPYSLAVIPIRHECYRPADAFEAIIQPHEQTQSTGATIHHLTPTELARGKPENEVLEALLEWLPLSEPCVWLGHFVRFDQELLRRMFRRAGVPDWQPELACTAGTSVRQKHGLQVATEQVVANEHRLEKLLRDYDMVPFGQHRAASDAAAAAHLFMHQLTGLKHQGLHRWDQLRSYVQPLF